jgi:hypothetical protein
MYVPCLYTPHPACVVVRLFRVRGLSFLLLYLHLLILVMWITVSFIWMPLGCTWLRLVLFSLLVVAALNDLAVAEFCCVLIGHHSHSKENRITVSSRILNRNSLYT